MQVIKSLSKKTQRNNEIQDNFNERIVFYEISNLIFPLNKTKFPNLYSKLPRYIHKQFLEILFKFFFCPLHKVDL